ncbi:hypothetical protein [Flavobacterium sp. 3HN19-14]|uniref:hypothetical protein n=1 Tax=Flavobacterium sp. 3HN19-14 TaxID=3448133 RepID=UPI003EE41F4B
MQVTKEDRIFKSLALLCVFSGFLMNYYTAIGAKYKLMILLPMVTALIVLGVRKYIRDKETENA